MARTLGEIKAVINGTQIYVVTAYGWFGINDVDEWSVWTTSKDEALEIKKAIITKAREMGVSRPDVRMRELGSALPIEVAGPTIELTAQHLADCHKRLEMVLEAQNADREQEEAE